MTSERPCVVYKQFAENTELLAKKAWIKDEALYVNQRRFNISFSLRTIVCSL